MRSFANTLATKQKNKWGLEITATDVAQMFEYFYRLLSKAVESDKHFAFAIL